MTAQNQLLAGEPKVASNEHFHVFFRKKWIFLPPRESAPRAMRLIWAVSIRNDQKSIF